jgi:hypothetical protein
VPFNDVGSVFIDPSSPRQNVDRNFNGRLRDELLNGWQFDNLLEAQVLIGDWRVDSRTSSREHGPTRITPVNRLGSDRGSGYVCFLPVRVGRCAA